MNDQNCIKDIQLHISTYTPKVSNLNVEHLLHLGVETDLFTFRSRIETCFVRRARIGSRCELKFPGFGPFGPYGSPSDPGRGAGVERYAIALYKRGRRQSPCFCLDSNIQIEGLEMESTCFERKGKQWRLETLDCRLETLGFRLRA